MKKMHKLKSQTILFSIGTIILFILTMICSFNAILSYENLSFVAGVTALCALATLFSYWEYSREMRKERLHGRGKK